MLCPGHAPPPVRPPSLPLDWPRHPPAHKRPAEPAAHCFGTLAAAARSEPTPFLDEGGLLLPRPACRQLCGVASIVVRGPRWRRVAAHGNHHPLVGQLWVCSRGTLGRRATPPRRGAPLTNMTHVRGHIRGRLRTLGWGASRLPTDGRWRRGLGGGGEEGCRETAMSRACEGHALMYHMRQRLGVPLAQGHKPIATLMFFILSPRLVQAPSSSAKMSGVPHTITCPRGAARSRRAGRSARKMSGARRFPLRWLATKGASSTMSSLNAPKRTAG